MRVDGICLVSKDVRRLAGFYALALHSEAIGSDTFQRVPIDGTVLTFYTEEGMEGLAPGSMDGAGRGGYVLDVEVESREVVDAEHARLTALGVPVVKPPIDHTFGRRSCWFRDPDGNILNLFAVIPRP